MGTYMRRGGQRGFTLIEMIVVLVVLGLAMGLVLARGPARSQRLELDAVAREVTGALRMARSRAIAEDRVVLVSFAPREYRVDGRAPTALPKDVILEGARAISFMPDGGSSGADVILRSADRAIAISIDWLTGRMRRLGNG